MMIRCLDALDSSATGGVVRIKVGDAASNEGLSSDCGVWGTGGFVSRPDLPSSAGACEVLTVTDGNERRVIGTRDRRQADKVGTLDEGDRAIVGSSAARILVKKGESAVVQYTEATSDGSSIMTVLSGEEDKYQVIHGGGAYFELKRDSVAIGVGKASIVLNKDGSIQLMGTYISLAAPGGNLGLVGPQGEQPPAAPVASILAGPTGMAGVPCLHWTVSPL